MELFVASARFQGGPFWAFEERPDSVPVSLMNDSETVGVEDGSVRIILESAWPAELNESPDSTGVLDPALI